MTHRYSSACPPLAAATTSQRPISLYYAQLNSQLEHEIRQHIRQLRQLSAYIRILELFRIF